MSKYIYKSLLIISALNCINVFSMEDSISYNQNEVIRKNSTNPFLISTNKIRILDLLEHLTKRSSKMVYPAISKQSEEFKIFFSNKLYEIEDNLASILKKNITYEGQLFASKGLAIIYHFRGQIDLDLNQSVKNYINATGLYNYAINVIKRRLNEHNVSIMSLLFSVQELHARIAFLEEELILKFNKDPFSNRFPYKKVANVHKNLLRNMRSQLKTFLPLNTVGNLFGINPKNIEEIQKFIKAETKNLISILIKECQQVLGDEPCPFAFIGLGSLARCTSTLFSDLESMILINTENNDFKQYFRNLTNFLHFKIINLGETMPHLLNINSIFEFYDTITLRGFCFDSYQPRACKTPIGKEGKYELIHSPEIMAEFQYTMTAEDELINHLPITLLNSTYIAGDKNLLRKYKMLTQEILNKQTKATSPLTIRSWRSLKLLHNDLTNNFMNINKDNNCNVKTNFYKPITTLIENLGLYYDAKTGNSFKIINYLYNNGYINSKQKKDLMNFLNNILWLRLFVYSYYNAQQHLFKLSNQSLNFEPLLNREPLLVIESSKTISNFYIVFTRLVNKIMSNLNNYTKPRF